MRPSSPSPLSQQLANKFDYSVFFKRDWRVFLKLLSNIIIKKPNWNWAFSKWTNCGEGQAGDGGSSVFSRFSSNFAVVIKWKLKSAAAAQRGWKPVCVSLNWSKGRKLLTMRCVWELILDHVCGCMCVCVYLSGVVVRFLRCCKVCRTSVTSDRKQLQQEQQQLPLLGSSETLLGIKTMWPKRIHAHYYISCNVTTN